MANVGLFHPGNTIINRITPFTKLVLPKSLITALEMAAYLKGSRKN